MFLPWCLFIIFFMLRDNSDISGYDNLRSIIADTFFAEYGFWEKWGLFFKLLVKDWGFSMFVGCLPWIVVGYVSG